MKACDIIETKGSETFSISKDKSIHDAIVIMAEKKIGCLLVLEDGKLIGILSERDIISTCAKCPETKKCDISIESVMTKDVVCGNCDDDIVNIMNKMKEAHIRHLPILKGDTIEGMVSMRDVVRALLEQTTFENKRLHEYILGKYPG